MRGYCFAQDVSEPSEARQVASCLRCGSGWVNKIKTLARHYQSSVSYDACSFCWDERAKEFRHESQEEARAAQIDQEIELLGTFADETAGSGAL